MIVWVDHFLTTVCMVGLLFLLSFSSIASAQKNVFGENGLILNPTARMSDQHDITFGASYDSAYQHSFLSYQAFPWMSVNLRQTTNNLSGNIFTSSYEPGLDLSIRLLKETRYQPDLALGFRSLFGSRRHQGEYLVANKRYYNIDTHLGLGWGRLSNNGHLSNPFKPLSSHFNKKRQFNTQLPDRDYTKPEDFFTGQQIGLFGGVHIKTPIKNLDFQAEYSSLDWRPEQQKKRLFKQGSPLSIGLQYTLFDRLSLSTAWQNLERWMVRLSFSFNPSKTKRLGTKRHLNRQRYDKIQSRESLLLILRSEGLNVQDIQMSQDSLQAWLTLDHTYESPGATIQHAARQLAAHVHPHHKIITLFLQHKGLTGQRIDLLVRDYAPSNTHRITPAERWHNANFSPSETAYKARQSTTQPFFRSPKSYAQQALDALRQSSHIDWKTSVSLLEPEHGVTYRNTVTYGLSGYVMDKTIAGVQVGLNTVHTLDRLGRHAHETLYNGRQEEERFADRDFFIDQLYHAQLFQPTNSLFALVGAGYLEELYAGIGASALYRPSGKRFAIGAELWQAVKRDPDHYLALNEDDQTMTGHLDLYYDMAQTNGYLHLRIGKYLVHDIGASLGYTHFFDNGMRLSSSLTWTNNSKLDDYNSILNSGIILKDNPIDIRLTLTIPLHHATGIPIKTTKTMEHRTLARPTGQRLNHPFSLYEMTDHMSQRQIGHSW